MRILQLTDAGRTDRGPRPLNQDYFYRDAALGLFVVADGMGGHKAGEVASRMAVETVVSFVQATQGGSELTWPFPFDMSQSMAANRLSVAMRLANRRVYEAGHTNPQMAGMGTTIVAAFIEKDRIVIGHVGDSRAYRMRGGKFQQLTRDHTWVAAMLAADASANAADHPMRHVLTSGIGMREDVTPAVTELTIGAGDEFLLCSDGVHGYASDSALRAALALASAEAAAEEAVRVALAAGGTDNATAVVLRFV